MTEVTYPLRPIGRVASPLTDLDQAPRQADEGAPAARLVLDPGMAGALDGLRAGAEVIVLTWLDRANRDVLVVHPRGDETRARQGVFSTRSPDRPNPIGLHVARITAIDGTTITVDRLEALDQTPVVDIKPVLEPPGSR